MGSPNFRTNNIMLNLAAVQSLPAYRTRDDARAVYIPHKDLYWSFELCLGEVVAAGWSVTPKAPHEKDF